MNFEITTKEENALLKRTELTGHLSFTGATPSRSDTIKLVANKAKGKPELTIVKKLIANYGGDGAQVSAYIYTDKATLEKVERQYMRTRNTIKEEVKAEPVAEEKPVEEEAAKEEVPAKEEKAEEKPAAKEPKAEKASEVPREKKEDGE